MKRRGRYSCSYSRICCLGFSLGYSGSSYWCSLFRQLQQYQYQEQSHRKDDHQCQEVVHRNQELLGGVVAQNAEGRDDRDANVQDERSIGEYVERPSDPPRIHHAPGGLPKLTLRLLSASILHAWFPPLGSAACRLPPILESCRTKTQGGSAQQRRPINWYPLSAQELGIEEWSCPKGGLRRCGSTG